MPLDFRRFVTWIDRGRPRRWLELVVLAACLAVFVSVASEHAERFNLGVDSSDQSAYLAFAERARREYGWHLDGSRGPGYPLALLAVHEPGLDRETFFGRAKTFTVWLTAFTWLGLWPFLRRLLPLGQGLAAWAVIGLTCLVHYAPYVKAEAPYFALNCVAFLLVGTVLAKPSPRTALLAGLLVAAAYLFKNSARILLPAYAIGVVLDLAIHLLGRRGAVRERLRAVVPRLVPPCLLLLGFLLLTAPFLILSERKYGKAFYNVNDFYAWYDSWGEAKKGTRAHEDRAGWPKMREQDIPTARKYVESHSSAEITRRFAKGWKRSLAGLERRAMLSYAWLYLAAIAVLAVARFRQAAKLARGHAPLIAFAVAYLVAHALLSAWFEVIASGPRVLAAGFPVLIVACAVGLRHLCEPRGVRFAERAASAVALIAALWLPLDVSRFVRTDLRVAKGGR